MNRECYFLNEPALSKVLAEFALTKDHDSSIVDLIVSKLYKSWEWEKDVDKEKCGQVNGVP